MASRKMEIAHMLKVVQCWDDGVVNDIRLAEIFRKYNAKATFNLNPGFHSQERIPAVWNPPGHVGWSCKGYSGGKVGLKELKEVYSGFQVASHCWRHELAGSLPDAEFAKSALDARRFLEDIFQQECRGFAWPCGKYTPGTMDALREAGFAYGRTVENSLDVRSCKDPMAFNPSCHFQDNNFWKLYAQAKETGVFYFWGHSYEMLDSEGMWGQLEGKIRIISEDPDAVWADVIDIVPKAGK